ncbi:MAG: antitoxin [Kiritimatiellia bacterium]|nr:antitoxin [Kiritimatiellia bacterium]
MQRTQIQLPDRLFKAARALAGRKEISLAELVRRGLEYMIATSPEASGSTESWDLPTPHDLQAMDPFKDEYWRAHLHGDRIRVAESSTPYKPKKKP